MKTPTKRWNRRAGLPVWPVLGIAVVVGCAGFSDAAEIDFNREIRPILSENCFACHGPDEHERKADLRVDTAEGLVEDLGGYQAVVPGEPEASELIARVFTDDPDDIMPTPKSKKTLTAEEKELLRRWVAEGAKWQDHWAFEAAQRSAVPSYSLVVKGYSARNEIDQFVLARLREAGLDPAPEADKHTLVRRVTLDLTGLPPTPEEVRVFVKDESPEAYEKLVERLLESPKYGEHRARYWLDAARYADTHGFHFDNYRSVWPYRDWVVRAFNENMPFDRFTIEQLAGDLLPDATIDQRVATGFNRCNPTTNEGGVINEEYFSIYAKDRVDTTSTVWMGLTMGCASCHDHKFDPWTQRDYYRLLAYFNNTTQPARDGNKPDSPPNMRVPAPEDRARWDAIPGELAGLQKRLGQRRKEAEPAFKKWLATAAEKDEVASVSDKGLVIQLGRPEGAEREVVNVADGDGVRFDLPKTVVWTEDGMNGPALVIQEKEAVRLRKPKTEKQEEIDYGDFDSKDAFSYGGWIRVPEGFEAAAAVMSRMFEDNAYKGWDLWLEKGGKRIAAHMVASWPKNALKVQTKDEVVKPGEWTHVFVTYDGSSKASGVSLFVNGEKKAVKVAYDKLDGSIRVDSPFNVGKRSRGSHFTGGAVEDLRVYGRKLSPTEVATLADEAHFRNLLAIAPEKRTKKQTDELRAYYLDHFDKETQEVKREIAGLEREKGELAKRSPITLVMEEKRDLEPVARVLNRGEYDQPGEEVRAGVPAALLPVPEDAPANRLGFARWLVQPEHPLTARVAVNRLWQEFFGTGIVKTAEDFGTMGEPPSHPELLDWLAVEFVERGWDVKHVVRLIVTSGTYRQSSRVTPGKLAADGDNRLLSRGPRYRLDAETLRDQALFVSGLLVDRVGGPPVKPYQPSGLWKVVAYPKSDTANFKQDGGDKLYRRSLYTFWKRTSPPPNMAIFDAPERESCIARRERTNTPLQALVLMNDPQYVEAARRLAEDVIRTEAEKGGRLETMHERVLGRLPEDDERGLLMEYLGQFEEAYRGDPEAAAELIQVGDSPIDAELDPVAVAAWTMLANQLMNLDEFVCKE